MVRGRPSAKPPYIVVEQFALTWLEPDGRRIAHDPDIEPGMLTAERYFYGVEDLAHRPRGTMGATRP